MSHVTTAYLKQQKR